MYTKYLEKIIEVGIISDIFYLVVALKNWGGVGSACFQLHNIFMNNTAITFPSIIADKLR